MNQEITDIEGRVCVSVRDGSANRKYGECQKYNTDLESKVCGGKPDLECKVYTDTEGNHFQFSSISSNSSNFHWKMSNQIAKSNETGERINLKSVERKQTVKWQGERTLPESIWKKIANQTGKNRM